MPTNLSVPALDKTVKILNLLTISAPLSAADIAKQLSLPRSSVHGLLQALQEADLIRRLDERHFGLGTHVMYWANGFLAQQDVVAHFQEEIALLPDLAPYTLTLSTLSGNQVVYLACRNSNQALGFTFRIGMQAPVVFTATGKSMLSLMSADEVAQLTVDFPEPITEYSIRQSEQLSEELRRFREWGYAVDNGQLRVGMLCFGVAVADHTGQPRFGVAASLLEQEVDETVRAKLTDSLKTLAQRLSYRLGYRAL